MCKSLSVFLSTTCSSGIAGMEATGQSAGTSNGWLWQTTPCSHHAAGRPCTTLVSFPQDCASPSNLQQTYCPEKALQACLSGAPIILCSIVVTDIVPSHNRHYGQNTAQQTFAPAIYRVDFVSHHAFHLTLPVMIVSHSASLPTPPQMMRVKHPHNFTCYAHSKHQP